LDAGGKRIHRAEPGKVGEVRGIYFSPATRRRRHFGQGMNVYDAMSGERRRVIHEDRMQSGGNNGSGAASRKSATMDSGCMP
jgi:hypothetical protein